MLVIRNSALRQELRPPGLLVLSPILVLPLGPL